MAAFRQSVRHSTARKFTRPIPDINYFEGILRDIVTKNPFGCSPHYSPGKAHPPVEIVRELYTAKFVYLDDRRKRIGAGSEIYHTIGGFRSGVRAVLTHAANVAAHGGRVEHDAGRDSYAVSLRCHDAGGEIYYLSLARKRVTLSSYRDEAIRDRIGSWMDTVTLLQ